MPCGVGVPALVHVCSCSACTGHSRCKQGAWPAGAPTAGEGKHGAFMLHECMIRRKTRLISIDWGGWNSTLSQSILTNCTAPSWHSHV